jgi:large subunit ribosomal protein L30
MEQLVVVRVRGSIQMNREIKDTLKFLHLHKQNYCVLVPNNDNYLGMVRRAKDYVTWGEVDPSVAKALTEKKGEPDHTIRYSEREEGKDEKNTKKIKIKKFFRLEPPLKGFGRKGIKKSFENGGALGYRGTQINDLVKRMLHDRQ